MRVVADTNVLVSAIVFGGTPGRVVELAAEGSFQLVLTSSLIDEFRRVLRRKFEFSDGDLYRVETLLRKSAIVVEPTHQIDVIVEDPDDNRVLEAAHESGAEFVVSGDRHLLGLGRFGSITVVSPRDLLRRLGR